VSKATGPNLGLHSVIAAILPSMISCVPSRVPSIETIVMSLSLPAFLIAWYAPAAAGSLIV